MTREIYLVRHGHCQKAGTLLGQCDVPLTAEGLAQARLLAATFATCGVERVLSSNLRRAIQTAECIAAGLGILVEIDDRLNEISYGDWDGRPWQEIEKADPEAARRKLQDWWTSTPPGGELFAEFLARVNAAWLSIQDSRARVSVVVAHHAVNAVLMTAARRTETGYGQRWKGLCDFQQEYGTFYKVVL